MNLLLNLLIPLLWAIGLWRVDGLFGKAYLPIDKERIGLAHQLFGLCFRRVPPSWRDDIGRLELIPRHTKRDFELERQKE
ncbi:hypothetical protein NW845_00510 [Synechococcus sp. H60.2]|uniref:hypothetical protein n=1 Tax=Synechococcus sp. H60.2 TaxID=2964518 RepID=UPI0039C2877A